MPLEGVNPPIKERFFCSSLWFTDLGNEVAHELCVLSCRVEDTEWNCVGNSLHLVDHSLEIENTYLITLFLTQQSKDLSVNDDKTHFIFVFDMLH